ncbi:opacity protein-like surface antigen [Granulicella aggregans]|uniref:Opacity protein-like surface antigen n=1 Tax=Granulicella aggregans TaxID=474949 RepID=A0A7W7ZBU4_9BACT|nr:porin family protein [Granulicella aggregans]MBB5056501.1 opacity protein-like surface antigen [Granulicella aggregans]
MLRLMTARAADASSRLAGLKVKAVFLAALGLTLATAAYAPAYAQNGKIGPAAQAAYDNKYEVYGGINYMNFQAGQNLPKRMNFAGAEMMGTYWLNSRLGVAGDYRFEGGTTPVLPSPASFRPSRQLVLMNVGMAGVQYRGPKNHYAAIDYHALVGVAHGQFNGPTNFDVGLYTDRTKPIGAFGGSLDYNRSRNLALRLQPDLIVEHFGSEYREFFAISAGVIYRFGKQ